MKTDFVTGVDIGGSHITAGLVNITTRTVVEGSCLRRPVDPHANAEVIITAWADIIREATALSGEKLYHVGIAMPGPFDYEGGTSLIKGFNKYESLYGLNVKELLAQRLGIRTADIKLKNDAAAFLQGEIFCGAVAGYEKAVGITIGTGLGSAKTIPDGTIECGVNTSPLHGTIAEEYISIRWFLKRYKELTGKTVNNVKTIAALVPKEAAAAQIFQEFTANLATVLQRFMAEEQPDVVVIGGGIANAFDLFAPQLTTLLQDTAGSIPIKQSLLGETAAMAGAACIFQSIQQTTNSYL